MCIRVMQHGESSYRGLHRYGILCVLTVAALHRKGRGDVSDDDGGFGWIRAGCDIADPLT